MRRGEIRDATPPSGGVRIFALWPSPLRHAAAAWVLLALAACAHAPNAISVAAPPPSWTAYTARTVALATPVTVVDNARLVADGWVEVSFAGRLYTPTERFPPGAEAQALAAANANARLVLELGPYAAQFQPGPTRPWRVGTRLHDVVGVVVAPTGDDQPHLRLTAAPRIEQAPRPVAPPKVGGDLTIASFNVLNFFNGDGADAGFPTTRGARNPEEFARQRAKTVAALAAVAPDVAALMEVENDGYQARAAIADLCAALNAALGPAGDYRYVAPPLPRTGGDEITVGLIYRAGRVRPRGAAEVLDRGAFAALNRAPIAQAFEPVVGGRAFLVVANHLKSKSGCPPDDAANADRRDGQACWNAARVAAARALADWLAPTPSRPADVLILGDLNAHGQEDPLRVFRERGYVDLVAARSGEAAYSFVFAGESGRLDHALASAPLAARVTGAGEWHINADEADLFDYRTAGRTPEQQRDWYRADPYRSSDHDPLLIGLRAR